MSNITRRAIMGATAAVAASTTFPVAAKGIPADAGEDPTFAVLEQEFDAAMARMRESFEPQNAAEARYFELIPLEPPRVPLPDGYQEMYRKLTFDEFGRLPDDHPLAVWEREEKAQNAERRAAWSAECERIRAECRVDETTEAQNATIHEATEAAYRIIETPARTLAGIVVKLRVADQQLNYDEGIADTLNAIAIDVRRLAGERVS